MDPRLLREINRLFDELVHDPWRRMFPSAPVSRSAGESASLLLEIPLKGRHVDCLALTTEGHRLTVALSTVGERFGGDLETSRTAEECRHTFELPEGTMPKGFEARFEAGVLRLRVELGRRDG